jgi:hypothetical protein
MEGIQMTTPAESSTAFLPAVTSYERDVPAERTYRTSASVVAVHFDGAGKGRIVFLPFGAVLHIMGRSSCLPEGFEVVFEHRRYNVFEFDVLVRSTPIRKPMRTKCRAVAA